VAAPSTDDQGFGLSIASSLSTDGCGRDRAESSMLALSISLAPNLRVATAQTKHMPFYLRTFFRVLSSRVPPGRTGRKGRKRPITFVQVEATYCLEA
jgi:hypothetical protein